MIRARISSFALAAATLAALGAPLTAAAQTPAAKTPIKKLMGENFGGLQTILYGLISANYAAVPGQADVIAEHAADLPDLMPDSAKGEREKFLAYANNLGAHAKDMKTIALELTKRDQARAESSTDYLREALASHYGGMVTMCVACHNRFRPLPVQP
jgi:cytochrome c556